MDNCKQEYISNKVNIMLLKYLLKYLLSIVIIFNSLNLIAEDYQEGNIRFFDNTEDGFVLNSSSSIPSLSKKKDDNPIKDKMNLILKKIINENRIIDKLDPSVFFSLPIGISSDKNGSYMIVIDKATIYKDHAIFSAFMIITNPFNGVKLHFRADDIAFTFKNGLLNGLNLKLFEDVDIPLFKDSNMKCRKGSYVEWDCKGFKKLNLAGSIDLSEKKFIKVNPYSGKLSGRVTSDFLVSVSDFQDILLELSFEPFKITGFDEAYFHFTKLTLDFSDTENAPGFKLPSNYPEGFSGEMENLWRGFYIQKAEIFLSNKFENSTSIYAENLILDNNGLSGVIGATNILSLDKGKLGSWEMSIDNFNLEFITGDVKALTLEGRLIVQGSTDELKYNAYYDSGKKYHFGINTAKKLNYDVFGAQIDLFKTSRIEVSVVDDMFMPTAILDGEISFACSKSEKQSSKKLLILPKLSFQGMRISAEKPNFDIEYLAMASSDSLSFNKFPITLTKASFEKQGDDIGRFNFGLKVNFSPSTADGIVGDTEIGILAQVGSKEWKYKGLKLKKVHVVAKKKGTYKIDGSIEFIENDPVYGNGFRGDVEVTYISRFKLNAVAVFGKTKGFRYFFVDAFYASKVGLQATPFILNGFGGGLFHKVRQSLPNENVNSALGKSLSDIAYVPDSKSSIGIKAAVKAGIIKNDLISCKTNFAIIFNKYGGVNQISFFGEGLVLPASSKFIPSKIKKMTAKLAAGQSQKIEEDAIMKVSQSILMDFKNETFHTEMEVFLNVAGVLKGLGPKNSAGRGVLHIDPDKWYLNLGTPTDRMGVDFIGVLKVGSYFMAGHDIPDAMTMHPKVIEYLGLNKSKGNRKQRELSSGRGLAFGADFEIDTNDLTFLKIFYAQFELGFGYDIMLLDYGPNAYCKGRDGSFGMNGWYAKGQAYAYFGGKIGIEVPLFGKSRKFEILDIRTAAALQIKGPNPTNFFGIVGGSYRLLGGMIKGSCKFEVKIGEKCDIQQKNDLSDLTIIGDLSPMNKSKDVSVFSLPQAVFNMPIENEIKIADDKALRKTFKIRLKKYSIYSGGKELKGSVEWNNDKTSIVFTPAIMFSPNTKYEIITKVSFMEKIYGRWKIYKDDKGKEYVESKTAIFTTGELPDKIPESYIKYNYPIDRQANFYRDEYATAYVKFTSDVSLFFARKEYKQIAKWSCLSGEDIYAELKYYPENQTVETKIPGNLSTSKFYKFMLVNQPISDDKNVDRNVKETNTTALKQGETTSKITTRAATGTIDDGEEKAFFEIDFRTSKYTKFLDKIPENELDVRFLKHVSAGVDMPGVTIYGDEMFDEFEIYGNENYSPLIKREAILENTDWYQKNIYPLMYKNYPLNKKAQITNRNLSELGIPPTKNIYIYQIDYDYTLSDNDIDTESFSSSAEFSHFVYGLPITWASDYLSIRNNISNLIDKGFVPTKAMNDIINKYPCPQLSIGKYPIMIKYIIPGRNITTSYKIINMINNIEIRQVNFKNSENK